MVLIDITPQALIERLRMGKIYRPRAGRVGDGELLHSRTICGGCASWRCARSRSRSARRKLTRELVGTRQHVHDDVTRAVGERLLALVSPRPSSQRLVRRAWRSARRLGSELDLLWVRPPGREPSPEEEAPAAGAAQARLDARGERARRGRRGPGRGRGQGRARARDHLPADRPAEVARGAGAGARDARRAAGPQAARGRHPAGRGAHADRARRRFAGGEAACLEEGR